MSRGTILPVPAVRLRGGLKGVLFVIRRVYEMALRYFLGQDAFISYSRSDAFDYAGTLASLLTQKGSTVFCDQAGTPPGLKVPREVLSPSGERDGCGRFSWGTRVAARSARIEHFRPHRAVIDSDPCRGR